MNLRLKGENKMHSIGEPKCLSCGSEIKRSYSWCPHCGFKWKTAWDLCGKTDMEKHLRKYYKKKGKWKK